ncbi:MAG: hypothetical protein LBD59_10690 [Prevotellaceae bacterium]|jgi:hypothetical protein|nr:hypothetical protein [Prevotellaceae bacterium]
MKRIVSIIAGTVAGIVLISAFLAGCSTKTRVSFGLIDESGGGAIDTREEAQVKYIDNSLLGRWSFDDADLGRNSANGKLNAKFNKKPATLAGVVGKAIELNPAKKTVIEVAPEILPENGIRELTFSAWIAPVSIAGNASIICKDYLTRTMQMESNRMSLTLRDSRYLSLGINCGGNYVECDAPVLAAELCDGRWHLVGGTFDGKQMRVYLDGREIASLERQVGIRTSCDFAIQNHEYVPVSGAPLYIGSTDGKSDFFNGRIDEVSFYSKALDAQHFASLYADAKQPASETVKRARNKAIAIYAKAESFIATLDKIDRRIKTDDVKLDELCVVELERLLQNDFPDETNKYIHRWNKNPIENITLDNQQRDALANRLAEDAFEYLPLIPMQWSVLSTADRTKWERVKWLKSHFSNSGDTLVIDKNKLMSATLLYEMEALVDERPRHSEAVAPRVKPETPETRDLTAAEAQRVIENDWLFQCDNHPDVARSTLEIGRARKLLARLALNANTSKAFSSQLDELATKAATQNLQTVDTALYFAVRKVKRDIMFSNPAVDFDAVMYIDNPYPSGSEWNHETRHRLGYMGVVGGRLIVQKGLHPGGKMTQVMPQEPLHGHFWRPDLSFDGKRILFSFKPHNEKNFHIYETDIDGKNLRQLSAGIFDDLDPIYLPDGKNIMFLTTRGHIYVRCMPPTNAFVMARMPLDTKPGDKNLYLLSRSGEPEYAPSVLDDGRVVYTRWEYTDKPLWRAQSLWTMQQNGTMVQTLWGNQSVWPDLLKDARQIPNSNRIMFTGSAHHNWFSGSVAIIDPSKGFNFPNGLTKVTQDLEYPESGNGAVDPVESNDYYVAGQYNAYYSPYPLGEKDFIVSANNGGGRSWTHRQGKFVLLLMDTDGNREIINEGAHHILHAMPVRKRKTPPVRPDLVEWPSYEERDNPKPGIIYSNNVYDGAPEELKGKAKYLRIWSIDHKTYTYWYKRNLISTGPEISAVQSEGIKKIIGTVPIEADGSVNFVAPSGIALHFQLLDENQRALQTMRSFTGVQPAENRGCLGCHESHSRTQTIAGMGSALKHKPAEITPVKWKDISVSFERYVQPVLDNNCAKCHSDPKQSGYAKFNSKSRNGFIGFKEPYMTLLGWPTWGTAYRDRPNKGGGFGFADIIMVEAFNTNDPVAYSTPPPMTKMSYKSRLVDLMSSGKHHGVKVDDESLLRVIHWVDAMGPYYGFEELQRMEDPLFHGKDWLSQRPRVKTAPIVPRPGPLDPFFTDEAYAAPDQTRRNNLPECVKQ